MNGIGHDHDDAQCGCHQSLLGNRFAWSDLAWIGLKAIKNPSFIGWRQSSAARFDALFGPQLPGSVH